MQNYSAVERITVISSPAKVNALLADYWTLLDIFHDSDGLPCMFWEIRAIRICGRFSAVLTTTRACDE